MSSSRVAPCWLWLLAGATLAPAPARAEPPKPEKVLFQSFDKVELRGTFYPSSAEGTKSPCVLFLHKIGGNRDQDGWEPLATELQEKGFAVLSFDFRGHGESTTVRPEDFWGVRSNAYGIRGSNQRKDTIEYKSFLPSYYPMLVNDVAAAKVFLEQKNNARECNANELMLIGAEEGASLGLVWVATEWARRKRGYSQAGLLTYYPEPEGRHLAAFVALSLKPSLAPRVSLPWPTLFKTPRIAETPMCFFAGQNDEPALGCTRLIYDKLLNADNNKLKYTFKIELENVDVAGHDLLRRQDLGVNDLLVRYLVEKIKDARAARAWTERDVPIEGRPSLNPLVQVPLNQFGIAHP